MRISLRTAVVAVAAGSLALGACGGGSSTKDLINGGDDSNGQSTDNSSDSSIDLGDVSGNCLKASAAFTEATKAFDQFSAGTGTTIDIEKFKSDIEDARSAVPDEIKGAYDTYMDALLDYADIYKDIDPNDPTSAENMSLAIEALGKLTSTEVMAALDKLTTYFTTECAG